jgi:transcriptional regulator with PAS, ATPase and Fis domain
MIELSEYGKYDISGHLKKLGRLGEKIKLLLYRSDELNEMKSLRISSQSGIIDLLTEKYKAPLFLLNRHGNVVNCSKEFLDMMNTERNAIIKKGFNEIFREMSYEDLFFDIEKVRDHITKKEAVAELGGTRKKLDLELYPIANSEGQISHIIGIAEKQ